MASGNTISLQKYLHERIPISKAMGVEALEATLNGVKSKRTARPFLA
jgi:hypothetical protein